MGGSAPRRKKRSGKKRSSKRRASSRRRGRLGSGKVYRPSIYRRRPSKRMRSNLRRARSAGFRFNPGVGGSLRSAKQLLTLKPWQQGLTIAAGAGMAIALPNMLSAKIGVSALQSGWGGVAFRGVVSLVASAIVGSLARSQAVAANLAGGAMAVVAVDALRQISALQPVTQYLPTFGLSGMGWSGYGVNDYLALQGMRGGLGNPLPWSGVRGLGAPMTAGQMLANQAYYSGGRVGEFLQLNAIGAGAIPQAKQIALETSGGVY